MPEKIGHINHMGSAVRPETEKQMDAITFLSFVGAAALACGAVAVVAFWAMMFKGVTRV